MRANFHLKTLTVAVAALSIASVASAAGLDRSGQDITAFLQDGTYAEAVYTYIEGDVSGKDLSGNKIGDIAESYDFFRYGVKADINDTFSIGILYDEPFGAAADYSGNNSFVDQNPTSDKNGEGTNVEVRTESITGIIGAKLGESKNFQVYGGPVAQRVQADVKLRGTAYELANGYTTHISSDQDYGWLAGVAYSKPEIALKAALTYRSEIDHTTNSAESYPLAILAGKPTSRSNTIDITTPESLNFDFQTGINPTTLATAKVRWVPWSDFAIVPSLYNEVSAVNPAYGPDGLSLVSYDEDQWQVELGLAKRLTPVLAVTGTVGWDSGAGNPVTSLGPIEGYYSAGLGAKYNVTENWAVSAGGKYLWFGDAEGQIPNKNTVSNFEDNDGFALAMKLSYQAN
mgnify:CR=1 FL=1